MKTVILAAIASAISLSPFTSVSDELYERDQIDAKHSIPETIPVIFDSKSYRACLSVWEVTVDRTIGSNGWLLEKLGIPVAYTDYSCELGGQFVCPTPECLALLKDEDSE